MNQTFRPAAEERVRAAIVRGDGRRRRRIASARLWRVAPFAAALCLAVAVVGRALGWPAAVPVAMLVSAVIALGVYCFVNGRSRPLSDAVASTLDADAGCGGELRSASWFANRPSRDAWAELHVSRAADRLDSIDWSQFYPAVRVPRTWITTALLIVATLGVAVVFPGRDTARANTSVPGATTRLPPSLESLPPELLKQLEDLLAAAEEGTLSAEQTTATTAELRELLARIGQLQDRKALKDLARALEASRNAAPTRSDQQMKALAARARHAAETNPASREFREAMEELARNLSEAAATEEASGDETHELASSEDAQGGEAGQMSAAPAIDEAAIESVKEAQASAGGSGVVMMSKQEAASGTATPGFGVGGSGSTQAEGRAVELEALRQEMVEASTDNAGANVNAPVRRRTEQGQATTTFTNTASRKSDQSRAAAPPAVPESRRIDVQRYFTRKQ